MSNGSWHQACLPINKTGIGVRRAFDQIKAAYISSISQSASLAELITGQSPTADQTFNKMVDEINYWSTSQLTQNKIQEDLDKVALNNLFLQNQTSEREKARLLSFSLPQSGAWLSASPISALGHHLCQMVFVRL